MRALRGMATWRVRDRGRPRVDTGHVLHALLCPNCDVIMLQDDGDDAEAWADEADEWGFQQFTGPASGEAHDRCACHLLIRTGGDGVVPGPALDAGPGAHGRRPATAYVGAHRTLFVSWCAEAGPAARDGTAGLVAACAGVLSRDPGVEAVIIGGGFNAGPDDVDKVLASVLGTAARAPRVQHALVCPGQPTRYRDGAPDRELDFFVSMTRGGSSPAHRAWLARGDCWVMRCDGRAGEHDPVIADRAG